MHPLVTPTCVGLVASVIVDIHEFRSVALYICRLGLLRVCLER